MQFATRGNHICKLFKFYNWTSQSGIKFNNWTCQTLRCDRRGNLFYVLQHSWQGNRLLELKESGHKIFTRSTFFHTKTRKKNVYSAQIMNSANCFALLLTLLVIKGNQGAFVTLYDSYCVRNIGCETEFQDMILGVSFRSIFIHDFLP